MAKDSTSTTIGLVAGAGQFPELVIEEARAAGQRVAVVGFSGHTDEALAERADAWTLLHIGQLGKLIKFFKREGADRVMFAGAVNKPKALDLRPDLRVVRLLFTTRTKGDDALLRAVIGELEKEGLSVAQAADLVPSLRGPSGVQTTTQPSKGHRADLAYAWNISREIGRLDIGQCLVVREGMVAAVEAMEGTDEAIRRGARLGRSTNCVVLKTAKPDQDERIDLPAIGLETVRTCLDAGIACLGYEAGKTLFFDRAKSIALADENKLPIVGVTADDFK